MRTLEHVSAATAAFFVAWAGNTAVLVFLQVRPSLALVGAQLYVGAIFLIWAETFAEGGRVWREFLDRRRERRYQEGNHG